MALNEEAKIGNLKRSIDLYIYNNLEATEGLNVDYDGLPFDDTDSAVVAWVQPRTLALVPSTFHPSGRGGGSSYSEYVPVDLQFNIFAKKSGVTTTSLIYDIRDMVAGHFEVGQDISLYEATGTTVLSTMRVREVTGDTPMPETNELLQHMYSVEIGFTRLTSKP